MHPRHYTHLNMSYAFFTSIYALCALTINPLIAGPRAFRLPLPSKMSRSRRVPSGPESLKPAEQNGGASACGRGVGWALAPASGLEVCRYFESLAVICYCSANGNIIAAFSKTPDSKKAHGLTQGKLLNTIAIAHLPLGWWYTSHFPLLITWVIAFRQSSMPSMSIQPKACFSLFTSLPFWCSSVRPLMLVVISPTAPSLDKCENFMQ